MNTPGSGARTSAPRVTVDYGALSLALIRDLGEEIAPGMVPVAEQVPDRVVTLNQIGVALASTNANINLTWPTDGILLGIGATTEDGLLPSMYGCLLRVQVDGTTDLFSTGAGNGAGYMSFGSLSLNNLTGRFAIKRKFKQAAAWNVSIVNTQSAVNVVCDLYFAILDVRNPQVQ
jgi:hypothetical protein